MLCPLNFNYRPQSDSLLQRAAQKSFGLISGSQSPFPKVVSIIISLSNRCHFVTWRAECRQEIWVIFTHGGRSHDTRVCFTKRVSTFFNYKSFCVFSLFANSRLLLVLLSKKKCLSSQFCSSHMRRPYFTVVYDSATPQPYRDAAP